MRTQQATDTVQTDAATGLLAGLAAANSRSAATPGATSRTASDIAPTKQQALLGIIKGLPQAAALKESDMLDWIGRVMVTDPDRALWHAARAGGFGGSDIGPLVQARRGEYSFGMSAHDVVGQKLLMYAPRRPNAAMRRGMDLEPLIKRMFLTQYGAKDLTDTLRPDAHPTHRWMRYSPDLYVELPDGQRALVDLKSTSDETVGSYERSGEVPIGYACQLHHGAMWARAQGVRVDRLLLVSHNFDKWDLDTRALEESPELHEEIIEAGNYFWERHVLTGVLPPSIAKPEFQPEEKVLAALRDASERVLTLRCVAKQVDDEVKKWEAKLKGTAGNYELGDARLSLNGVTVSAKPELNVDVISARLESCGIDVKQFTAKGDIDKDRAEAILQEIGRDEECRSDIVDWRAAFDYLEQVGLATPACRSEALRIALSTKKNGPEAAAVQARHAEAKDLVQRLVDWSAPNAEADQAEPVAPEPAPSGAPARTPA